VSGSCAVNPSKQDQNQSHTRITYLLVSPRFTPGRTSAAKCYRRSNRGTSLRHSALGVLLEELDRIADGEDRLRGVVGNLATEFLLERHDEFHRVEAVGAEIIDEARVLGDLLRFHPQVLHHDLLHPLANVAHRCNLVSFELGSSAQRPRAVAVWTCVVS